MNFKKIIELQDVSKDYGNRPVLEHVNVVINEGDFVAITGPNGGGKTTLLRLVLRLMKPTSGQVLYYTHGHESTQLRFGYLPQKNQIDSRFPITVKEVVASGLRLPPLHHMTADENERVSSTLQLLGLDNQCHHAIGSLSGGQLQRALLGRAIIGKPNVLILDEPLSYIDKRFEPQLYQIVEDISRHATIILVSHEMSVIASMATRHFIVEGHLQECSAHHHF